MVSRAAPTPTARQLRISGAQSHGTSSGLPAPDRMRSIRIRPQLLIRGVPSARRFGSIGLPEVCPSDCACRHLSDPIRR
jgi:hypothetical protein